MIQVIKPGLYSSIQDLGRFGFRRYGVPLAGAMDRICAALANRLLGNGERDAVLEFTMQGPELFFTSHTTIAVSGAGFEIFLNGTKTSLNSPVTVPEHSTLTFGTPVYGVRGYLAVAGGFLTTEVLGSRSYDKNITHSPVLKKGDVLPISQQNQIHHTKASLQMDMGHFTHHALEAMDGPEFPFLKKEIRERLFSEPFTVLPNSNRMAYLLGKKEGLSAKEIVTGPVMPGTVQLTPSGQLVLLMRDCQTTGGYARILQLTETAINCLAQKRGGDTITFSLKKGQQA